MKDLNLLSVLNVVSLLSSGLTLFTTSCVVRCDIILSILVVKKSLKPSAKAVAGVMDGSGDSCFLNNSSFAIL